MSRASRFALPFRVVLLASLLASLLSVLVAGAPALAASSDRPVAVMSFKNLNADPELDWLRVGIAETMIADLRREGHVVVERDQLDRALAEIALQETVGSETSTAARLGRMVGAHTVVVGGYQRAGGQVRITARFVTVETGIVRETAKATGPLEDIFSLQDLIVERLIGRKPKARRAQPARSSRVASRERASPKRGQAPSSRAEKRPAESSAASAKAPEKAPTRKTPTKKTPTKQDTVDAYRLYAMSLQTSSQAERVRYLKQAIELDPGFRYALDDLAALERRIDRYDEKNRELREVASMKARDALDDPSLSPEERAQRAFSLLTSHLQGLRYRALLEDAERVYRMDLPPWNTLDVREYASLGIVQAHMMLKQTDLALQAGERHLQEFPGGSYYQSVDSTVRTLIEQRRRDEKSRAELPAALAEIEAERAKVVAEMTGPREKYLPQRLRTLDFRRCSEAASHRDFEAAEVECGRFLERYADDAEAKDLVPVARWNLVLVDVERGDFAAARARAERFVEEDPESAERFSLKVQMRFWPRD